MTSGQQNVPRLCASGSLASPPFPPAPRPGERRKESGLKEKSQRSFAQQSDRGLGAEGTTLLHSHGRARRKSRNKLCSAGAGRTLRNRLVPAPPGTRGSPGIIVSLALRGLASLLSQLHLVPPPPPSVGTGTCPEMTEFVSPSPHLWHVLVLETSCCQFLFSGQLGGAVFRGQGVEAHADHHLAARSSCHRRRVHGPHSCTLDHHCEPVSLTGKKISLLSGTHQASHSH